MVSRLTNDIAYIQAAVQHALNTLMRDIITVIGLVGYMLYTDWMLSLIVLRRLSARRSCRSR